VEWDGTTWFKRRPPCVPGRDQHGMLTTPSAGIVIFEVEDASGRPANWEWMATLGETHRP